jgi:hypothetical protein
VPGSRVVYQKCELLPGVLERYRALERSTRAEVSQLDLGDATALEDACSARDPTSFRVSRTASRLLGLSQTGEQGLQTSESELDSETETEDERDPFEAHTARESQLLDDASGCSTPASNAPQGSLFLSPASELHSEMPLLLQQQSSLDSEIVEQTAAAESNTWQSWEAEPGRTSAADSPSMIGAAIPVSRSLVIPSDAATLRIRTEPSEPDLAATESAILSVGLGATTDETETESEEELETVAIAAVTGAGAESISCSRTRHQLQAPAAGTCCRKANLPRE